jgi:hypothetical protein
MNRINGTYKGFGTGLIIGAIGMAAVFVANGQRPRGCEPVVDVEYKRNGKDWIPQTVLRKPVRDGERCLLAEAGS